jgi:hypothetical protein
MDDDDEMVKLFRLAVMGLLRQVIVTLEQTPAQVDSYKALREVVQLLREIDVLLRQIDGLARRLT